MKVLVADDTLLCLDTVRALLLELDFVTAVATVSWAARQTLWEPGIDVILVGGRWLDWARQLRGLYPHAYIIGRSPWFAKGPLDFFPWGNEMREPTLPLSRLLQEQLNSQERSRPSVNDG